jgi:hypothetical protein
MTKLSTLDLESITGGVFTPCPSLDNKTLAELRAEGEAGMRRDLAQSAVSCGLKLPTAADIKRAKEIRFEVPPNAR